jgi:hypothetical protein
MHKTRSTVAAMHFKHVDRFKTMSSPSVAPGTRHDLAKAVPVGGDLT